MMFNSTAGLHKFHHFAHLSTGKGLQNHCIPYSNTINSSNIKLTMEIYKAKEQ
jgi:hypothetical protein